MGIIDRVALPAFQSGKIERRVESLNAFGVGIKKPPQANPRRLIVELFSS